MARRPFNPTHPGEILKEDFMAAYGLSANKLGKMLNIPHNRISEIVRGNRSISADTALRLEQCFGASAQFWLNLQNAYELECAEQKARQDIRRIKPVAA